MPDPFPGRGPVSAPAPAGAARGRPSTEAVHNPASVPAPRRLEPANQNESGSRGRQVGEPHTFLIQADHELQHHITAKNYERLQLLERHWELGTFARRDLTDSAKLMLLALAMVEEPDEARVMLVVRSMRRVFRQAGRNRASGYDGLNQLLERGLVKLHVGPAGRTYELPMAREVPAGWWESVQKDEEQPELFASSGQPDGSGYADMLTQHVLAPAQPEKSGQPDSAARAQPEKSGQPDASVPPSHSPRVVDVVVSKSALSKTTTTTTGKGESERETRTPAALLLEAAAARGEKIEPHRLGKILADENCTDAQVRTVLAMAAAKRRFKQSWLDYVQAGISGNWKPTDQQRRAAQVPPPPAAVPMKSLVADAAADARRKLKALPTHELQRRIQSDPELSRFANAAQNLDALAALPDWAALRLWTCQKELP